MNKLKLFQSQVGYRYNSDTIFLYHFLTNYLQKGSILDIGCGCGILGLLIKRDFPALNVDMIDLQKENVDISKKNALENDLKVDIFMGNFLDILEAKRYDFLVSNPPFYHQDTQKSKNLHVAKSRYSTFLPFELLVKKSYKVLNQKGKFCFCYDAKQLPFVSKTLLDCKFGVETLCFLYPKREKEASLALIVAKKNFKGMCKILPSFIVSDKNGFTHETKEIYKDVNVMSYDWKM